MESVEPNKIEVGDIFSTTERGDENKLLIMVANIICNGEPGRKVINSLWGTKEFNSNGCSLNYKVSLDNGETWAYEDGEGHYVDTGWIGELIKMGHWSLEQKNVAFDDNFFDSLTESEEEFDWLPTQNEIGLKVRVDGKPFYIEDYYDQQDEGMFTSKVSGWSYCYEIIDEKVLNNIDCYIVKFDDDYPKVYFRKQDFVEKDFCNPQMNESEDDFGWAENLVTEPFHLQLIRDNPRKPVRLEDVRYIMFNPSVEVGDKRFNKIAYFLEDNDYYPETLEYFGKKTSYIEITKWIKRTINVRQNGRWNIGPELSEQELYNFSQTENNGKYWAEEFIFVDDNGNPINFLQNPFEF